MQAIKIVIIINLFFVYTYGMEHTSKDCMVQRKAVRYMISKILLRDNDKILCIGSDYGRIKQKCPYIKTVEYNNDYKRSDYDKILFFFSWKLMQNPQQVFTHSAHILKPEGRFCGIVPYYNSLYFDIYYQTLINSNSYNKTLHINLYGSKYIKQLLEQAGFASVECRIVNKPFIFKTQKKFAQWVMDSSEQFIAQKYCNTFVQNVVNNYLECCCIKKNQPIKLHLPYMIMSGYKI